jgi:hypothetical protein
MVLLSGNAWAVLQCSDSIANPAFGGIEILRLSASANAHGEFPSSLKPASDYSLTINCKETGGTGLTVSNALTNTIIRLSSQANAHAELPGMPNYGEFLSLTSVTGSISIQIAGPGFTQATCNGYNGTLDYVEIVRLSSTTNAHLESPYSPTPTAEYPYAICGAFSASAPPVFPDILAVTMSGLDATTSTTSPAMNADITVTKLPSDPAYTNTRTVLIATVCDLIYSECATATDGIQYGIALYGDPPSTPTIFLNREGIQYESVAQPYTLISPLPIDNGDIVNPIAGNMESQTSPGAATYTYVVDPVALGFLDGHIYRVQALALTGQFDHSVYGADQDEPSTAIAITNYAQFDITVDDSFGPGPSDGAGGDVFLLKKIDFVPNPPLDGSDFGTAITMQYKGTGPLTGYLDIIIRDGEGNPIGGSPYFAQGIGIDFTGPGELTRTVPIDYGGALDNLDIEPGETFTLYATIRPYEEEPVVGENDSETVTGNNSSFKTFTVLVPQETISVPDAPPWMSVFMALIVMGWLFVSGRKEEKKNKE